MPEVGQLEASIATLKEEIDTRKAAVADKEALLANHNPPIFQAVQVCPLLVFADVPKPLPPAISLLFLSAVSMALSAAVLLHSAVLISLPSAVTWPDKAAPLFEATPCCMLKAGCACSLTDGIDAMLALTLSNDQLTYA